MAYIIQLNSNLKTTLNSNDVLYVGRDVLLARNAADYAVDNVAGSAGIEVIIDGVVVSLGASGVYLAQGAITTPSTVRVGQTGAVHANDGNGVGVILYGNEYRLLNAGEVTGNSGVYTASFVEQSVMNDGLISGAGYAGIHINGGDDTDIVNTGVIEGLRFGIRSIADTGRDGVLANRVVNSGTISGFGIDGVGVDASAQEIEVGSIVVRNMGEILGVAASFNGGIAGDLLVNFGLLSGLVDTGAGEDVVRNHGSVEGSILTGADGDRLVSTGEISGDVDLGDTADTMINRGGGVTGDVQLGQGNDTYKARKGGEVDGRVQGGDNNDKLLGSSADDVFEGGGGFDTLRGRGGDDELKGGAGDDFIAGGAGDDILTGGLNADVFKIGRHSGDDTITDWVDGDDVLDLRALNIEISTSVGDVKAASQNRAGGVVIIDLDALGGDGSLEIANWNVNLMTAGDFIF
ncbi:calcium-binding protein [Albimonas sp. CAU 1670]|uniref:calcium-binding protein n=1 Tax=Albimonas sp. CAU 1670 TaxID=3032599 RepID=UPI0023D9A2E0|nr:calcium-binding protein [Albimonas sp. CAU 1670]MDF2232720.1 calcium-binding protein [Albimonas sp. CAU 1670]